MKHKNIIKAMKQQDRYEKILALVFERYFFSPEGIAEYTVIIRDILALQGKTVDEINTELAETPWEKWLFFLELNGKL